MVRRTAAAFLLAVALAACGGSSSGGHPVAGPPTTATASSPSSGVEPDDAVNPTPTTGGVHCGYVRWLVKTLADSRASQVNLKPVATTIAALRAMQPPYDVTAKGIHNWGRFPSEEQAYTVKAKLIAYNVQQDGDFHLVLVDSGFHSIIAEIPNPVCVKATSRVLKQITQARATFSRVLKYNPPPVPAGKYSPGFVTVNRTVTITGVVFFDSVHGQHGVAPNGVELHPVVRILFSGGPHSPTPTPSGSHT